MPFSKTSFAMGAVVALVLGSGTAYAANGGNFLLGKTNYAGQATVLKNANGTALVLNSKAGTPPLAVNSTTRVRRLNADLLDGRDQAGYALTAGNTGAFDFASEAVDSDNNGQVDLLLASAACPPGTRRTGGGGFDGSASGYVLYNGPGAGHSWAFVVAVDEAAVEDPANVEGSIVCYNPRGAVGGGAYRSVDGSMGTGGARKVEPSAELMDRLESAAVAKSGR